MEDRQGNAKNTPPERTVFRRQQPAARLRAGASPSRATHLAWPPLRAFASVSRPALRPEARGAAVGHTRTPPTTMLRHQLPVYSPLPAAALTRLLRGGSGGCADPVGALAELLARDLDARQVRLYDSGTHALQAAIRLAADAVGGHVALPAYSCFDIATAALAAGVSVRFYDLDPTTLGPEPASVAASISDGARVLVAGSLYGIPLEWNDLRTLVERAGGMLIEDAAQAQGSSSTGRNAGSIGDLSVLSFGRGKGWTGGGGGALLIRDPRIGADAADLSRTPPAEGGGLVGSLATPLKTLTQWVLGRPALYGIPSAMPWLGLGETHYHEPTPTRSIRRSSAGLALDTRAASEAEARHRRHAAESLLHLLREAGLVPDPVRAITPPRDSKPGYLRFPVVVPGGMDGFPDRRRARALGLSAGYPIALPDLDPLEPLLSGPPPICPGARALVRDLVNLPTHSLVSARGLEAVVREIGNHRAC